MGVKWGDGNFIEVICGGANWREGKRLFCCGLTSNFYIVVR